MKKIHIANIVGARPNFMKIAPIMREMAATKQFVPTLIHTGQHYDQDMSDVFFKDLGLPKPDIYLGVGSGTQAVQTAKIMIKLEKEFFKKRPDLILVVGDVNSTLAASLVGAKLNIPIAHVEAGLRSFDRTMPEEINRIITDSLSQYLFTTCKEADLNLVREGLHKKKIFFVGNVMIDSLRMLYPKAVRLKIFEALGLQAKNFAVVTLHRPSNVDVKRSLKGILVALREISRDIPVVFPIHPRTKKQIESFALGKYLGDMNIIPIKPLGYLEFLNLMLNCRFMLTDSGGIQEETTALNIPCLTLRKNTERPITIYQGSNTLVGNDPQKIVKTAKLILKGSFKLSSIPKFWDGRASQRIVRILLEKLNDK